MAAIDRHSGSVWIMSLDEGALLVRLRRRVSANWTRLPNAERSLRWAAAPFKRGGVRVIRKE